MSFDQSMPASIGKPILEVNRQTDLDKYQNADMVKHKLQLSSLGDRLRFARKKAGLTQKALAQKAGMSQSSVSELENGEYPTSSYTAQLADATGVRALWLAEGKGPMHLDERTQDRTSSSEIGLQPPSNTQNANTGAESAVMGAPEQHLAPIHSDAVIVKVFDARASMGLGLAQPEHDTVVDHIRLTKGWVRTHLPTISGPDSLAVISAYGDSMSPTFADGDILLVDRGVHDIKVDAVYVLALNNELYIKRIQRRITDGAVIIKSDNPLYDPVVVENGERDGLRVLGRVVWAWNGRKL